MKTLVLAELKDGKLTKSSLSAITAAKELSSELSVLIVSVESFKREQQGIEGVSEFIFFNNLDNSSLCASNLAQAVTMEMESYECLLAASNTFTKDLLPRIAANLDVAMISDVVQIIDKDTFVHPTYAGNVIETVKSLDPIKVLTVRATSFSASVHTKETAPCLEKEALLQQSNATFVEMKQSESMRPELSNASTVVSGGRALKSKENFILIEKLADSLNAAVGASRAAVDAGYVSNDLQVGQTGKVVAPMLYIAVGISGAIQHLAGMKDSKVIVSINKDPEAPINQIATYRLIADLFEVLPELTDKLNELGEN